MFDIAWKEMHLYTIMFYFWRPNPKLLEFSVQLHAKDHAKEDDKEAAKPLITTHSSQLQLGQPK